ncbi:phytanoyl-CoA dioxygenase, peroxisomal-like isoform X1 [Penaeus monodon]|uniref:phytanoyl-CoA dioxygenase, peroxisomal-like isoform X1 n=2 Tax=Penaeus monodon TaxID=6687 RepID=UPI0018A7C6DB|nr:phytanoyl-CoA dioxygenase, peroxisomal-like isoform X1 [Penaeus monodon]XP_037797880.1 phytanoyl-CoA dioxygenase, peroxisomal-like isoform X1 [Penaeus monodon]XP_037797881.1 phytanoyl-CoA dioxygenase, peroxisomal-like isoform X1 [Penaeus monodon]
MADRRMKVIFGHLGHRGHHDMMPRLLSSGTANVGTDSSSSSLEFQYTLDNPRLTAAQRAFYEENGFLVIPNLVPHDKLDQWKERFIDLVEGRVDTGGMTKMKDISLKGLKNVSGELIVNKLQDFVWDEVLSEHCMLPQILDYVECFTGPDIMAMHTMLINKPPDPGTRTSRHPLHQDLHYFPFRPANRIVCAWTAMEKVDTKNGCLFVLPGSHKGKLEQHDYPDWEKGVNKMYHGVRGFDDVPKTMLSMEKGDTVFFHPILLHGSGDNVTQHFRKAISCHYASSHCQYIDVKGTTQENIAKEVEEIALKRGVSLGFKEIWNLRSRCVRGVEDCL